MSSPRYDWWPYVKGIIRRYPELKRKYADVHQAKTAADLWELSTTGQREYEAVRRAIEATERRGSGRDRLRVVKQVLWDESHTLEGAALTVPCSYMTARRYHSEFIYAVAAQYGLMDGEG